MHRYQGKATKKYQDIKNQGNMTPPKEENKVTNLKEKEIYKLPEKRMKK